RGDDAGELAVLDPGRVEHLDVPDLVGEDDALAVTIEAAVDERPIRGLALRPGQGGAAGEQAVHEAVADVGEADEAAFPEGVIREGPRVEAGGHLAVVAESDADAFRDRRPRAAEDAGEERAEVGLIPPAVGPGRLALVAPVAVGATVQTGILRE